MWCDEARRIGGSAATVLHVQSTKPLFLVASLRGFAAASILNASRLFGSICFSEQRRFIKFLGRVIKGDQTLLPSALCQALWSHFNGPEKSSADRIEAKCKGECFICQLATCAALGGSSKNIGFLQVFRQTIWRCDPRASNFRHQPSGSRSWILDKLHWRGQ